MFPIIHEVPLIPQCDTKTCWYAAALMITRWSRNQKKGGKAVGADLDTPQVKALVCGQNITIDLGKPKALEIFAQKVNFKFTYQSSTARGLADLLSKHGPLMYGGRAKGYLGINNGRAHSVVIRGIDGETLYVNDPSPPGIGLQFTMNHNRFFRELASDGSVPILHA